jgi:DNA-directed RNA polymerase II subunit RPB1
VLLAQNIQSRVELQKLSWIGNWMVSYQNNAPYFGCVQDSLIGSAELTKSDVKMDKWHAMLMFANVNPPTEEGFNFDKMTYTGRELVSKFLPRINYPKKKATMYLPQYAPYIKYDPDEIYVQINRGELISGVLDKATVGEQVSGSIFHVINNEYGANTALNTIYNFHQVVARFFLWKGFTVGIEDINVSDEALQKVHEQTKAMIKDAEAITKKLFNRELVAPLGVKLSDYYEREQLNALEAADSFVIPILNDIDFRNNKLAALIFSGSKGKKQNFININGSQGQLTINGRRPSRNFSWGRTSPYFPRYDMSPRSLGFVETSYRDGIDSDVFPYAAGDARFSSINNALSTSISGAQSRISIKNLESILTNNLRQATKGENIVQILYAESGIDTRKTESVKFITAMISDEEMKTNYKSTIAMFKERGTINANENKINEILNEEYGQLIKDRQLYREIFVWAERNNPGQYLFDDRQQMPVNPYRIIEDILFTYEEAAKGLNKDQANLDPVITIRKVRKLCEDIPYMYFNSNYEAKKYKIPEVHRTATTLLTILLRMYLCTSNLLRKKVNNYHLDLIINKIKITFKNSLIDYGKAVGIIAAQCLSEPLTQYVLNSRHRSGTGEGSTLNVVERFKEILAAKATKAMKVPMMLIMVLPEYEKNKIRVQEIANHIEMMEFERFIISERVFFEQYGKPIHPDYIHEEKIIRQFEKNNAGIRIPGNLTKWCLRYEINKEELIINSMKLSTIITKLRIEYPDIFWVYTPENSDDIIIRAYLTQGMIIMGPTFQETDILKITRKISKTIIRGVENIIYTEVIHIAKSEIQSDGSIKSEKIFAISTQGTNLEDILMNPYIDKYRTQTNSIAEIEEIFGIEAASCKIITEIRKTMSSDSVIREHTSVFASEMSFSGYVTSIQKTGLQEREPSNVTLRLSFQSPIQVIENAAINNITDTITGISGPLVNGQAPSIGTLYNEVGIDEAFVEAEMKNLSKIVDDDL